MFSKPTKRYITRMIEKMLIDTCDIEKQVEALDQFGAEQAEMVKVATGTKCRLLRINQMSAAASENYGSQQTMVTYTRLALPLGTEIGKGYRVIIEGEAYTVTGVRPYLSDAIVTEAYIIRAE